MSYIMFPVFRLRLYLDINYHEVSIRDVIGPVAESIERSCKLLLVDVTCEKGIFI